MDDTISTVQHVPNPLLSPNELSEISAGIKK